jgi:hypothetical protein
MTKTFDIITTVEIEIIDDNIDELLKSYQDTIRTGGTVDDMMRHAAWNEARWEGHFCEGVGENGVDYTATIIDTGIEEI